MFQSFLRRIARAAIIAALSIIPLPATAAPTVNGWGVGLTDVRPDPAIKYGRLSNGMKYAVMRNATPPGTASVRLEFAFGSIAEADDERGLAHFIEHMAFNGTTHVAEGEMEKILQREGLAMGPDTNALTSFDTTTYIFNLPKADSARIDTALFLLREISSEMKLDAGAIDRERAVILSEGRARGGFVYNETTDLLRFQLPEAPYGARLPVGTEQVIRTATPEMIRSLYARYYRPENATLVFVGDADPALVEAKVVKAFESWNNTTAPGRPLPRGRVNWSRGEQFHDLINPARPTLVDYTVLRPWNDSTDTLADRRRRTIEALAVAAFNRRLQKLSAVPGSSVLGGSLLVQERRGTARITSVKLVAKDGAWKDALTVAEQEVRRAREHGFTATEVQTAIAQARGLVHNAADQAATRTSQSLAAAVLNAFNTNQFVTTPRFRAESFDAFVRGLAPAEVSAAFRALWTGSAPLIHLTTKTMVPKDQLLTALAESRKAPVAAPSDTAAAAFAYKSFGTRGRVVSNRQVRDLGLRQVRFANNVGLTIKKTPFETGKVRFLVRLGGGTLDLPKDKPGLGFMLSLTSPLAGVGKHSLEDLQQIFAGKSIRLGSIVADDAFVSSGTTTPGDLSLQMKVSAAYMLDPGFRPEAQSKWAATVAMMEQQIDADPESVARTRLPILLANGDGRFGVPEQSELSKRNLDEARVLLRPLIESAPIEITIVGDIDERAAIEAVASSFGALPARQSHVTKPATKSGVAFRTDRSPLVLFHNGSPDKALVEIAWPTNDNSKLSEVAGLTVLRSVLSLILMDSIREKLGDTYSVNVRSVMSDTFPGFGYLSVSAIVAPDKAEEVAKAIDAAAEKLSAEPLPGDLLARARNPEVARAERQQDDNGYWLAALAKSQSEPEKLDRIRNARSAIESVTATDIQKLAQRYLQPTSLRKVLIVSRKLPARQAVWR